MQKSVCVCLFRGEGGEGMDPPPPPSFTSPVYLMTGEPLKQPSQQNQ